MKVHQVHNQRKRSTGSGAQTASKIAFTNVSIASNVVEQATRRVMLNVREEQLMVTPVGQSVAKNEDESQNQKTMKCVGCSKEDEQVFCCKMCHSGCYCSNEC